MPTDPREATLTMCTKTHMKASETTNVRTSPLKEPSQIRSSFYVACNKHDTRLFWRLLLSDQTLTCSVVFGFLVISNDQ